MKHESSSRRGSIVIQTMLARLAKEEEYNQQQTQRSTVEPASTGATAAKV